MPALYRILDAALHYVTDPYCNVKIGGHHLPFWGWVQLLQWHMCNLAEGTGPYQKETR